MSTSPSDQDQKYNWISVYKTLSRKLLEYRKNQSELLKIVRTAKNVGLPTISLTDKVTEHTKVDLEEIDPFTFFANFNRGTTKENWKKILEIIISEMGLKISVPSAYKGIPIVNPQKSWFFPYKYERNENDIEALWELFYQAVKDPNNISDETFRRVMNIKQVGLKKITMGLFWIKPESFLPLDSNTINFLEKSANLSIDTSNITLKKYLDLNNIVRETFPEMSFVQISDYAYEMPEENIIAIFGNSEEFFPVLDKFYKYLENLTSGSWLENRRRIGIKESTYLRATKKPKCLDATILLLAYKAKIIAEFHVKAPAREFDPPIQDEDGKTFYSVGFRIKSDEYGPLIFLYDEPLHKSEIPIEKGFPKAYRGGAYVDFEALEFLRDRGKRVRHPLIKSGMRERKGQIMESEIDDKDYNLIKAILSDKPQLILYGPPGTGKTYIAREFSKKFVKFKTNFKLIQFHPSYSYEDFVEGISTRVVGGRVVYEPKKKIFRILAEKAQNSSNERFVLIIDEINRGDISTIFGELILGLEEEYRGESISTPYLDDDLVIPPNLYMIGTMNSADHSIKLLDKALRRRFNFLRMDSSEDSLTLWLENNGSDNELSEKIKTLYRMTLKKILEFKNNDRDSLVGHTYFFKKSREEMEISWQYSIMPLVEDLCNFDEEIINEINGFFKKVFPNE